MSDENGNPHNDDPFKDSDGDRPRTLAERAAAAAAGGDDDEDGQQELFAQGVLDGDNKITFKSLIKPGDKVITQVKMSSAAVPMRGSGLVDPTREIRLAVRCFAGSYTETPKAENNGDGTRKVEEWKVAVGLKPHHIEKLGTVFEALDKLFDEAIMTDPNTAAATLERFNERMTEYLTSGMLSKDALG